jgi:nucleotide-binding universal stress UspA family protein
MAGMLTVYLLLARIALDKMYENILIPTDGSDGVENAIGRALDLARTGGGTIHALHAVDIPTGPSSSRPNELGNLTAQSEKHGRAVTNRITELATEHELESVRTVEEGVPFRVILEYIDQHDIDVVVMGTTSGEDTERSRLGSTTQRVIPRSPVPVLAVPLDASGTTPNAGYGMYDTIVVPTDGSDPANRAGNHAFGIAERYGADVHLIYVLEVGAHAFEGMETSIVGLLKEGAEKALDELATEARERTLPVTTDTLRGAAHDEILGYAEGVDADLIAMGSHGVDAGGETLLGSTTARTVRQAPIPVLTSQ